MSTAEQAITAEIEAIKASIQPVIDQITALEREIVGKRQQLANAETALAYMRGQKNASATGNESTAGTGRKPRGSVPTVTATVDELVNFLRGSHEPLTAGQIRTALDIPSDVPSIKVSQFLAGAVQTGRVTKQGEKRSTRYSAA